MRLSNTAWTKVGGDAPTSIIIQNNGSSVVLVTLAASLPGSAKLPYAGVANADHIECLRLSGGSEPIKLEPDGMNVYARVYGADAAKSDLSFIEG